MIKALITNNDYPTLLLDFPSTRMFLAINLGGIGINTPANEIKCNADDENGISVKLFGDTEFDNRVISVLHDRNLSTANSISELIAFMPRPSREAFENDVMQNGIGSYDNLITKIREFCSQDITEKFFCPLTVQLFEKNEYGDFDEEPAELDGRFAAEYEDDIRGKLNSYTARDDENMAEYFDGSNSAQAKIKSLFWDVKNVRGELYGEITAKLSEPLTESEKSELVEFITGQNSDGLGEGFEQQEIKMDEGSMFVSFWNSGDGYFVKDQDEFDEYIEQKGSIGFGGIE